MTDETSGAPRRRGPVIVEIPEAQPAPDRPAPQLHEEAVAPLSPADAPPILDDDIGVSAPEPRTMQMVARLVGKGPSPLTRLFFNSLAALLTFLLSVMAWQYVNGLIATYPLLGWVAVALFAIFTVAALAMAVREYAAWARFGRLDGINRAAGAALANGDLDGARKVVRDLQQLYAGRAEMTWARDRLRARSDEAVDAQTLLSMAEADLLGALDQEARREIEAASRTVAAATALIPLAFADVAAALAANLRMIRRIAEIYGGRAGAVGGWRLARTVMTHLVATGAVAAGDDLIHTVAGGGVLAKVSKRFGEGVVNGALTARVGIAAMEVCRPMPFVMLDRPKVANLVSRGLKGLFGDR